MSFDNIIGNERTKELLNKTINSGNILNAYMFIGIDGIGKKKFAIEFAKMILCQGKNKPCNNCKSCIEIENNSNPDFMIIDKDYDEDKKKEKNLISINQIRYMNAKMAEKPIISDRKVYIINNSDFMNKEAQNCLLKTLEEPPKYGTLILIAENESKLLNTIKSRCIKINFNKLKDDELLEYFKKNNEQTINTNMISYYQGSIGKAMKINENIQEYLETEKLINNMNLNSLAFVLNNAEVLYRNKDMIANLLEYINVLLLNSKQITKINCIQYVEEAKKRLNTNSNYDMTIDNLLVKMWEEINEKHNRS